MSTRKLFGTDGIRGKANVYPMTCEIALSLGRAVTHYFQETTAMNKQPLIVIGKDTRRSCYMLEQAFSAGVCSQGGRVIFTGPLPTPGVAFVTQSMRADAGVMISASHNKYHDNGIKLFDSAGNKLPDHVEKKLEEMILNPELIPLKTGPDLGNAKRLDEVMGRYIVFVKAAFSSDYGLEGMRIVLDCANGAAYKIGPMIFSELGAEVFPLGVTPNGININDHCGSLYPEESQDRVKTYRADIGICLDGDADRVVIIDERGKEVDGDKLIGILAKFFRDTNVMKKGDAVVGTIMTNMGLEEFLNKHEIELKRTNVGDRYIIEEMKKGNHLLGGEPSGHIIIKSYATTGDGILAALKTIEAMKFYQKELSELVKDVQLYPQEIRNIQVTEKPVLESIPEIVNAMKKAEEQLGTTGRFSVRYSGTESLARVMVEAKEAKTMKKVITELSNVIEKHIGVK